MDAGRLDYNKKPTFRKFILEADVGKPSKSPKPILHMTMPSKSSSPTHPRLVLATSESQSGQMGSSDKYASCLDCRTNYSDASTVIEETPNQIGQSGWSQRDANNANNAELKSPPNALCDDVQMRQRVLEHLLQRSRQKAEAEYLRTSDASVFQPFLAPFTADKEVSKSEWVLDQPTQRWYLYNPDTEEVMWCPTAESFI